MVVDEVVRGGSGLSFDSVTAEGVVALHPWRKA